MIITYNNSKRQSLDLNSVTSKSAIAIDNSVTALTPNNSNTNVFLAFGFFALCLFFFQICLFLHFIFGMFALSFETTTLFLYGCFDMIFNYNITTTTFDFHNEGHRNIIKMNRTQSKHTKK